MNSGNKTIRQNFETSQVRVICVKGGPMQESRLNSGYTIELLEEYSAVFGGNKVDTKLAVLQFGIAKVCRFRKGLTIAKIIRELSNCC